MEKLKGWGKIAQFLKISRRTARRWHKKRPMPLYKIENVYYAKDKELDNWFEKHKMKLPDC